MKYATWIWNNVIVWIALGAVTFFALVGVLAVVAGPHLHCMVVS